MFRHQRTLAVSMLLFATQARAGAPVPALGQGIWRGFPVTYLQDGNRKLFEGDILLDHVTSMPVPMRHPGVHRDSIGVAYPSSLWPANSKGVAQIPYIVTSAATQLNSALSLFNKTFSGVIQFVPQNGQADYVNFDFDSGNTSGQCESNVGRIGGEQITGGSGSCSLGTLLHEFGHIVGLYHEMARPDRDTYLTVNFGNVIKGSEGNFTQPTDNFQDLTLFDYASVMMYLPFAFTRNGGPVLETIPPGMPLSSLETYSAGDIDGIDRLYGKTPHKVTVTSNPPGLSVIVDGTTITTPQAFSWTLKSTHTLAVSSNAQTLSGNTYVYGRWNDNTEASHGITVAGGNNRVTQPSTLPAVTVYSANFVQLSPYSVSINPAGSGTVSVSPQPQTYAGATGSYFVARQPVQLTATPSSGYAFVAFFGSSEPFGANPKADYVPDGGAAYAISTYFSTDPVTTIETSPGGFYFIVDGAYYKSPQNFTNDIYGNWGPGTTHTLTGISPNQPYSVNTRYLFDSWSDGGALSHTITVPTGSSTINGIFTAQYVPIVYANPTCAGTITVEPTSSDGFYNAGTALKVTETPVSGWDLTAWTGDLGTRKSVQALTVSDEELAVANYNTSTTSFGLSSLSPASFVKGSAGGKVKILGEGFTSASQAYVNGYYRQATVVSSKEIDVTLMASDLTTAGALPIGVANFPAGSNCSTYTALTFFVLR